MTGTRREKHICIMLLQVLLEILPTAIMLKRSCAPPSVLRRCLGSGRAGHSGPGRVQVVPGHDSLGFALPDVPGVCAHSTVHVELRGQVGPLVLHLCQTTAQHAANDVHRRLHLQCSRQWQPGLLKFRTAAGYCYTACSSLSTTGFRAGRLVQILRTPVLGILCSY
jgi:hypothetical protein